MSDGYVIFAGCSFTAGDGWTDVDDPKSHPNLWVNLCHQNIPKFQNLALVNLSQGGASNTDIFEQAVSALTHYRGDSVVLLCQWTAMPRYQWQIGFELWDTKEHITTRDLDDHDVNLSDGTRYPRKYINDIKSRFRAMHHLHWEILKVVKYSKILEDLAERLGSTVFFVNGLCPWDKHYFTKLENVLPEDYTEFTKKTILDIDSRSDQDIKKLYDLAHHHYTQAGGINQDLWINLYDSFRKTQSDFNFDGNHPGKQSNQLYSSVVENRLKQLNFI